MTAFEFLAYLRRLEVKVWADGEQLRIRGPKEALTPAVRADLARHKAELLTLLQQARLSSQPAAPPLLALAREQSALPLSFAQERLWFIDALQPGSAVYNITGTLRLRGTLKLGALWRSLTTVVARQGALRTSFPTREERPVQWIAPAAPLPLPVVDLRALPLDTREAALEQLMIAASRQPFELARGPLVRVRLFRLDTTEHVLFTVMHHIISDGWSNTVFANEMLGLYLALAAGRPSPLPPLPVQYADYAIWQREWLQGPGVRGQGATAPLPPPAGGGTEGGRSQGATARLPPPAGGGTEGGAETRRHGDKEQGASDSPSPTPHPPSPIQAQLAYWQAQLKDAPTMLALPTDRPRPPVQTYHGAVHPLTLPAGLTMALRALSQQEQATLFMTLLSAFVTLLYRYSGQEDLVAGTAVAGRTRPELEGLIGFFINTLPLRADLSGNPPFRTLLQRMRVVTLSAFAHQDLPFERLVEELQPERDLSRTPLFQVIFMLQNFLAPALDTPDLQIEVINVNNRTAKFDLTLTLGENEHGLRGLFEYNTDLFDTATITRMAGHFRMLLEGIVAAPDRHLADLPLLTAAEREQLLAEWNATATAFPHERCIHELFAAQAARTPDAIAVVFDRPTTNDQRPMTNDGEPRTKNQEPGTDDQTTTQNSKLKTQNFSSNTQHPTPNTQQLTYHELDRRANQLAHYLRSLGVGPETRVALAVERSVELLVGLLGILKAGAAYLPLDLTYPAARLAFLLDDAQAPLLLTQRHLEDNLPAYRAMCVYLDDADLAAQPTHSPPSSTTPDNLAYVTYTSGSTGLPKGVAIPHRGVVRLVQATDYVGLSARETFVQLAPLAFDASTFEVWGSLLNGARLVVLPAGQPTLAELGAALLRHQVSTLWLTASLFQQMVETQPASLRDVRQLLAGGDVLSMPHVRRVLRELPECRLINGYGPTENTTFTCCATLSADTLFGASVPIGRPIANTTVYLLDAQLQPVPIGVPGEICIGGVGVARGYLRRPELTAERFIPNPFAQGMGDGGWGMGNESSIPHPPSPIPRLYRTGDLARYRADGNLEFLGRIDAQVKLRGYRIEPGEIEAALRQHPAVGEAVVVAREDVPGDKRLVAYVVTSDKSQVTSSFDAALVTRHSSLVTDVRAFLKERLPDYMVPSAFVFLETFPLTSNGKLDRRALPAPDAARPELEAAFVAPRTPTEEVVAGIWSDVLSVVRVGVDDNFFALGGHSLMATQVIARVRDAFQVELPLRTLFEAPTVAAFAAQLDRVRRARTGLSAPPLRPVARGGSLPLSFAQQRLWFLDQLAPGRATYTIPMPMRLTGALNLAALSHSLDEIVRRHEALRTTFATVEGYPIQVIAAPASLPLAVVDLQALPAEACTAMAEQLSAVDAQQPFDLARGPLVRVALLRLAQHEHILLLTMHHIIADAWSLGILIRELATLYTARATGRPAALPALPIQYADYAVWQQQWLQGAMLDRQLAYWHSQLGGAQSQLALPTDRPRPPVQTFRGAQHTLVMAPALSTALQALSRQEGVTLFMTLLAALAGLLARSSGQDDLLIGSPIANRTHAETEDLIGFFVNTLVLRTDLTGNPSVRAVLGRVREICLQAYAHQDVPFEKLVEALQPERDLSRTPLFQVLLVLQNAPMSALTLPDLTLAPLPVKTITAKFDLTVSLVTTAQGLQSDWEYNTDLFDIATIARMAGHFQMLLEGIVAAPGQRLTDLPLLTATERQLLTTWNATQAAYPQNVCIHELFAAQAARTPDAVAVVFDRPTTNDQRRTTTDHRPPTTDHRGDTETRRHGDTEIRPSTETQPPTPNTQHPTPNTQHLTYQELNQRANLLANHLRTLQVRPEVIVGICMERSPELVVGLLGVLKAGGAYVPLDPAYPTERLAFMLTDAQAPLVITQAQFAQRLPTYVGKVVRLDADWATITRESATPSGSETTAGQLAYVIYTSGSTGTPKGVAITHRSAVALIAWARTAFVPAQLAGVLAATSICFDLSVFELFVPLSCGGTVILVENALQLPSAPAAHAVTLINTVPSAISALVRMGGIPASAHTINLAGEVLPLQLVQQLYEQPTIHQVVNLYGPSEATTYSTWAVIPKESTAIPTIGQPIANTRAYLLDAQLQPVPIGVAGELYLGGAGLARGYLNRPDLTAEKFIPNPFLKDEGKRMKDETTAFILHPSSFILYKTGDLARYRPDGRLEFLGRLDAQVKIRGYRIELGEIEHVLRQHPAVQECVVLAREDVPGDKRLVAYVVTSDKSQVTSDSDDLLVTRHSLLVTELRAFLKERLPDYMVPSAFVLLDALPLTSNGKLDRRALPAPDATSRPDAACLAPRDSLELRLVQIWEDVLALRPVGITDNFFALGGHSLLAVRLLTQIEQRFGRRLPLAALFQDPTITQLAQRLRQQGDPTPWSPLVVLQPSGTRRPFFCVHPVSGSVLCYLELARALGADQPFYGLQAAGLEGDQPPYTQVGEMAAAYVAALRAVQPQGPYQLGGWSIGGVIAFEMARQLRAQGQAVALLALLDTLAPVSDQWRVPAADQDAELLAGFVQDLAAQAGQALDLSSAAIEPRAPEQQLRVVLAQAQALGLLPPDIGVTQIEDRLAVFKANLAAVGRYVPAGAPGRIVLFRTRDSTAAGAADPLLGWGTIAAGTLEVIDAAGDHYTMLAHPHVQELAERLRVYLVLQL